MYENPKQTEETSENEKQQNYKNKHQGNITREDKEQKTRHEKPTKTTPRQQQMGKETQVTTKIQPNK